MDVTGTEVMHASAIVRVAFNKLLLVTGVSMPSKLRRELDQLQAKMYLMGVLLRDAERGYRPIKSHWLLHVLDAAYLIWDMVDEFRVTQGAPTAGLLPSLGIPPRAALFRKTQMVKEKLRLLNTRRRVAYSSSKCSLHTADTHGSRPFLDEAMIVGRVEERQRIMDFMSSAAAATKQAGSRLVIIAIFGLGGVGKSTLANLIFCHDRFQDYCKAWVDVSQNINLMDIGKSIISQVSEAKYLQAQNDMKSIMKRLRELLEEEKAALVVLDGLSEEHSPAVLKRLKHLMDMLRQGMNNGDLIVVVTTRSKATAKEICSTVEPCTYPLAVCLHPLKDHMCWEIIKRMCRFEAWLHHTQEGYEMLNLGLEIARKCGGLPLAAEVIGSVNPKQWPTVLSETDIWNNKGSKKEYSTDSPLLRDVLSSLKLSYKRMPVQLRLCFAYCAIIPKGHTIFKDELIHQWISLRLIEPGDTSTRRQLGEKYIEMLSDISFLEPKNLKSSTNDCSPHYKTKSSEASSSTRDRGKVSAKDDKAVAVSFTMHDFVHALARSQVGGLLAVLDGRDYQYSEEKHCRYARLTSFNAIPWKSIPERLWALHCYSKMEINNDTFSNAKYLGVLDMRKSSMQRLPDAICHLRLLGYLDLSDSNCLRILPESFGNLVNLVHINLSGCYQLLKLPGSFGNLINMLHINLSGCCGLVKLPESFGNLVNLMHVNLSECSGLVRLPESSGNLINLVDMDLSGCSGLAQLPQSFGKLQNIKYLDLSSCSCVEGIRSALHGLIHLQHLNLSQPCCYLPEHRLHLTKLKDVWGQLKELRHLNLSMFLDHIFYHLTEEERLQYIGSISVLSSLEYLDLSHNTLVLDIPESLGSLSRLHTLDLSGCIRLKRITKTIGAMECLRSIVVSNCRGLETLSFVVHVDNETYSSNLVQLEGVMSCKELEISCLEKVKSLEEAKTIKLAEKQSLEKLRLDWTVGSHASVEGDALLEDLVPPNSLRCLELHGHNGRNLPVWLGKAISSHLPNLVEVTMEDITKCSDLPPFGLLPDLQRLALRRMHSITRINAGDLCGSNRAAFHRLSQLILDDMQNLREFNTIYYSGSEKYVFPAIDVLMIQKCSKLRFQPSMPRATMLVSTCEKSMSSSVNEQGEEHGVEEGPLSPTPSDDSALVTELQVEALHLAKLNWSLLGHLPPLHSLHISKCNDLTTDAEIMPFLSSLQVLLLSHCDTMMSLPKWLGKSISSNLPNLKTLTMEDIPACNDLPPLGVLPNLKWLVLRRMAKLRRIDAGDLSRHYTASFRRLSHFTLDDMESLEEFNTSYYSGDVEFMFPMLDELVILKCRKLRIAPRTPRAKLLLISDCGQLMLQETANKQGGQKHDVEGTSSSSRTSSTPVTEMMVEAINLAKVKPTLLCDLPPLYTFHIKNCMDLTTLPELILFLSSIKSLYFSQRDRLISLPEWLGKDISFRLPNLVEVTMEDISWCSDLPPFGLLPELKQLVLRRMNSITKIDAGDLCGHSRAPFRQLVRFTLDDMAGLREINYTTYNSGDEKCMLPIIKEMLIQKCNRLRFQLGRPRAKMLLIYGCDLLMLSSLYRRRHGMAEGSTAASLPPLTELMVETVPLAKLNWTLLHGLPPLHSLHMSNYNDLTTLTEIMHNLSSLKTLILSDCKSLISVPETLGTSISSHFPNLQEVTMEDIPAGCSELPLLGLLPGLQRLVLRRMAHIQKIDASDFSGGKQLAFKRLSQFMLDDMENLEEFNTRYRSDVADDIMFPDIEELVILKCPKLRFRPSRPRTKMLLISACDQLTTSSDRGERYDVDECPASSTWANSSAVTELVVEDLTKPLDKLNWNVLSSQKPPLHLHRLHIKKCDDLGDPSRKENIMNVLSSVKSLCFSNCNGLTSLPEYLEKFTSLEELVFIKCHSIRSLQFSRIEKLINLKCLCINDCPKLRTWCEWTENKKKLPNISII